MIVLVAALLTVPLAHKLPKPPVPKDNPLKTYRLPWVDQLPWDRAVDIRQCEGKTAAERLADAQHRLGPDGGVIYFPPGVYRFQEDIVLNDGVILRGVAPKSADARRADYYPQARIEFPAYVPRFEGAGEPNRSSFKAIRLNDPERAANCGVLNLAVNRGRIDFRGREGGRSGRNRFVVGCSITNAAGVSDRVPDDAAGQHSWQRYTDENMAAIRVSAAENALIANNRLPEGFPDDFTMNGYVLRDRGGGRAPHDGVIFDFNNRPGIELSLPCSGRGGMVRDNYVYATGRTAITSSGRNTLDTGNVIRGRPGVVRQTLDGVNAVNGSPANDFVPVKRTGCDERET